MQVRDTKFGTNVLLNRYSMLQNAKVTAFTVSELLKENQQGGINYPPPRLGLKRDPGTGVSEPAVCRC